jgi:hypothetical protein
MRPAWNRPAAGYGTTIVIGPVGYVAPGNSRDVRQRGSAGCEMRKCAAGKFHRGPSLSKLCLFDHLVGTGEQRRRHVAGDAEKRAASGIGDTRIESLARTYERPALRKPFAAFPADSKVA